MARGISFGQFNIVGGTVREDGPYAGVIEDRTTAESVADLYLVLQAAQPGSEPVCAELRQLIESQFGRPQYSLTGNLLQSLRAAQEHLRSWNRTTPADRHASAGVSCLAVRGDEAYLAQIGPALAYLRHDGLLRRLEPIEAESRAPLGTTIACSPCFGRFELNQGDTLLLVHSRFRALVDDETVDLMLSLPPSEALPEIYKAVRREQEFSALYLAVTGELRPPQEDAAEHADGEAAARAAAGRGRNSRPGGPSRSRAHDTRSSASAQGPYAHLLTQASTQPEAVERAKRARRRQLSRLTERRSIALPRPALYTIATVVALALAGWLGLPRLLQAGRQDRFSALLHDAQHAEATASATNDPGQRRALLERAQADLTEAATLRAQAPELISLRAQTLNALRSLDQVRDLPSPRTIADLPATPVLARSVTELAAGAHVYLLDNSSGKVYAFPSDGQSAPVTAVFAAGMNIEGIGTNKAVHLAIQPPGGNHAAMLYILDANRRLFSLDDGGTLRAVGLGGTNEWKSATALAFGGQDLYVLDSEASQIWHYSPTRDGFTSQPAPLLTKADLHGAAQLSVAGDIYVSTVDGHLLRFHDGRQEEEKLRGIDHPLVSPQPPILDTMSGLKYFADPGNQRIVAADAQDVFRFQYSGPALQGVRAIAMDPGSGLLYALSEQKLISAPLR